MDRKKNVQISQELFICLIRYFFFNDDDCYETITKALDEKLEALSRRELYTKSKIAPTEEEREKFRQKYLDEKGIHPSFRW